MIYKNTKKRKHFNKFRSKKYKGGSKKIEFSIQNLLLPTKEELDLNTDDSLIDVMHNTLKTYNINVEKETLETNFNNYLALINDAVRKVSNDYEKDYSKDENILLREFSKEYENEELKQIIEGLEHFSIIVNRYQNIDKNPQNRHILDNLYSRKINIINEIKEEEKENDEIIEELNERLKHNEYDFFKNSEVGSNQVGGYSNQVGGYSNQVGGYSNQVGGYSNQVGGKSNQVGGDSGGGFMDFVSKAGIFLGAMPLVTQYLTGTLRFNILEFITGKEREHLRKKILDELISSKKENYKEFLEKIESLPESYELDLYLNSFFMQEYLEKKGDDLVWEKYTNELRGKISKEESKEESKKKKDFLKELNESIKKLNVIEKEKPINIKKLDKSSKKKGEVATATTEANAGEVKTATTAGEVTKETTEAKAGEVAESSLSGGANAEEVAKAKAGEGEAERVERVKAKEEGEVAEAETEAGKGEVAEAQPVLNFNTPSGESNTDEKEETKQYELIKFSDEKVEMTNELKKHMTRFNLAQSTKEQEVKEKRMKEYYETVKSIVDFTGIIWDQIGLSKYTQFTEDGKEIEGKTSGGDVNLETKEGLNVMDLVAAIMSLSSGEYFDFTLEILPVLITTLPNIKFLQKIFGKLKGKFKKKKGPDFDLKRANIEKKTHIKKETAKHKKGLETKTEAEIKKNTTELQAQKTKVEARDKVDTELKQARAEKAKLEQTDINGMSPEVRDTHNAKLKEADTKIKEKETSLAQQNTELNNKNIEAKRTKAQEEFEAEMGNHKDVVYDEKTGKFTNKEGNPIEDLPDNLKTKFDAKLKADAEFSEVDIVGKTEAKHAANEAFQQKMKDKGYTYENGKFKKDGVEVSKSEIDLDLDLKTKLDAKLKAEAEFNRVEVNIELESAKNGFNAELIDNKIKANNKQIEIRKKDRNLEDRAVKNKQEEVKRNLQENPDYYNDPTKGIKADELEVIKAKISTQQTKELNKFYKKDFTPPTIKFEGDLNKVDLQGLFNADNFKKTGYPRQQKAQLEKIYKKQLENMKMTKVPVEKMKIYEAQLNAVKNESIAKLNVSKKKLKPKKQAEINFSEYKRRLAFDFDKTPISIDNFDLNVMSKLSPRDLQKIDEVSITEVIKQIDGKAAKKFDPEVRKSIEKFLENKPKLRLDFETKILKKKNQKEINFNRIKKKLMGGEGLKRNSLTNENIMEYINNHPDPNSFDPSLKKVFKQNRIKEISNGKGMVIIKDIPEFKYIKARIELDMGIIKPQDVIEHKKTMLASKIELRTKEFGDNFKDQIQQISNDTYKKIEKLTGSPEDIKNARRAILDFEEQQLKKLKYQKVQNKLLEENFSQNIKFENLEKFTSEQLSNLDLSGLDAVLKEELNTKGLLDLSGKLKKPMVEVELKLKGARKAEFPEDINVFLRKSENKDLKEKLFGALLKQEPDKTLTAFKGFPKDQIPQELQTNFKITRETLNKRLLEEGLDKISDIGTRSKKIVNNAFFNNLKKKQNRINNKNLEKLKKITSKQQIIRRYESMSLMELKKMNIKDIPEAEKRIINNVKEKHNKKILNSKFEIEEISEKMIRGEKINAEEMELFNISRGSKEQKKIMSQVEEKTGKKFSSIGKAEKNKLNQDLESLEFTKTNQTIRLEEMRISGVVDKETISNIQKQINITDSKIASIKSQITENITLKQIVNSPKKINRTLHDSRQEEFEISHKTFLDDYLAGKVDPNSPPHKIMEELIAKDNNLLRELESSKELKKDSPAYIELNDKLKDLSFDLHPEIKDFKGTLNPDQLNEKRKLVKEQLKEIYSEQIQQSQSFGFLDDFVNIEDIELIVGSYKEEKREEKEKKNKELFDKLMRGKGEYIGLPEGFENPQKLFSAFGLPSKEGYFNEMSANNNLPSFNVDKMGDLFTNSIKKKKIKITRMEEKTINLYFEGTYDTKPINKVIQLDIKIDYIKTPVNFTYTTTENINSKLTLKDFIEEHRDKLQKLFIQNEGETIKITNTSINGIKYEDLFENESVLSGGAKITKKKPIDDVELEAMINIKYRHNVSEKLVLNKQDMVLDKLLKLYKGRISDENLKKLKKVSEDQKVNYFRFTMTEVGNNFFKLNYSISDSFFRTLVVHLKIRSISDITPDKKTDFKKKYENIDNKSEEFKLFHQQFYELLNKKEELFKVAKKAHNELDKKEIDYSEYEDRKNEFELAKEEFNDFKNQLKKTKNKEIFNFLKDYTYIFSLEKSEEDFYMYTKIIQSNLLAYKDDLKIKEKYFLKLQELCKEEVLYIKNEFKLARYLKLQITRKNKEKLFEILEEMKKYFETIKTFLIRFNRMLEEKVVLEIKKENKIIQDEKNFIDTTLQKIKIKSKQSEFKLRMLKRENIFELFDLLNTNISTDILFNREIITKCEDFSDYIDYQINLIDSQYIYKKIIHKTKKKAGLIDISKLQKQMGNTVRNNVSIQKNKLTNLLKEIEILTSRKKQSKKNIKQRQNARMNNIDKLVSDISNLTGKEKSRFINEREIRERKIKEGKIRQLNKIKNTKKKSIQNLGQMSKKYTKLRNPMDLLVEKKILTKKKNQYILNREFLKSKKVPITKKMLNRIKNINKNLGDLDEIKSNVTFYNTK